MNLGKAQEPLTHYNVLQNFLNLFILFSPIFLNLAGPSCPHVSAQTEPTQRSLPEHPT